jgi:glutaredoxin
LRRLFSVWAAALVAAACWSDGAAPDRPPADGGPPEVVDAGPAATVYSYVDDAGRIHMVAAVEDIPERYRGGVLATDTTRRRGERLADDRALVLDLRRRDADGPVNYSVVDLQRRTRPAAGPAPVRDPGALGRRLVRRAAGRVGRWLGLAAPLVRGRVILYSAPWCGFCKRAAAFLRRRGVDFVERDIESEPAAAVELERKLRAAGLRGGGIPVLDIGGRLVIGFDRDRIEALLGAGGAP